MGGKLVQTLDSGMGWGNLHRNGDGEFFVGTGWRWRIFHGDGMGMGQILWGWGGDGDNFIYRVTLYYPLMFVGTCLFTQMHTQSKNYKYKISLKI